jgi:phosphoribosyl-ATP pyrophosphohydrolase
MSKAIQLEELFAEIEARRGAAPDESYSAQLLADLPRAARKLGEEASEAMVAALSQSDEEVVGEAADVMYHLLVVLAARGLTLDAVMDELARRAGQSGLAEKAARDKGASS